MSEYRMDRIPPEAQASFARKIAALMPKEYGAKEFAAAYSGAAIFLIGLISCRFPKPCAEKDFLINQIIDQVSQELMERSKMSEPKMSFADMVAHAKEELRQSAEENRTVESIALELPHVFLADPEVVGIIKGSNERNKALQLILTEASNNQDFKSALLTIAKVCLTLFPNKQSQLFNDETIEDRRQGEGVNGVQATTA